MNYKAFNRISKSSNIYRNIPNVLEGTLIMLKGPFNCLRFSFPFGIKLDN